MTFDPFADLVSTPSRAPGYTLPASALQVPTEDEDLFEQLRSDPKMTNIRDEIAHNKYVRILLLREFEQQSYEGRTKQFSKVVEAVREIYGENSVAESELYSRLEKILPASKMSTDLAKTISKLIETSGKLAEQQQKILEGTEIVVKGDSRKRMLDIFQHVIRPCCPPEIWSAICERARSFATTEGKVEALELYA